MRDRLLVAFVSLTVAVVAVFLLERAYTTSSAVEEHEQQALDRITSVAAALLGEQRRPISRELLASIAGADGRAVYVTPAGRRVTAGGVEDAAAVEDDATLTATAAVAGGGRLTLTRDADVVETRVANALLPVTITGLGVVFAAVLVALWLARRLSRPFTELAAAAGRIGRGDFAAQVPRSAVPEADAVAKALRASAEDLDLLVRRERDFAAHASHELRTPITAIRLELEDLALSTEAPPDAAGRISNALGQLDRLSTTVADLLDSSRRSRLGSLVAIDLTALVHDTVDRWRDLTPDRRITEATDGVVAVRMPAGALLQVMDVLLANAVTHGKGTITVSVTQAQAYVEVTVADEGPRDRAAEGTRAPAAGLSRGLATASEIAESLGGRLRLSDATSTTFSLVLPRISHESLAS